MVIFHSYVSLPEGISPSGFCGDQPSGTSVKPPARYWLKVLLLGKIAAGKRAYHDYHCLPIGFYCLLNKGSSPLFFTNQKRTSMFLIFHHKNESTAWDLAKPSGNLTICYNLLWQFTFYDRSIVYKCAFFQVTTYFWFDVPVDFASHPPHSAAAQWLTARAPKFRVEPLRVPSLSRGGTGWECPKLCQFSWGMNNDVY